MGEDRARLRSSRAVTEVRRRVTLTQRGRRGRASDPEWRIRNRPTRSAARMSGKHVDRLVDTPDNLPADIGAPILAAWNAATTIDTWRPQIHALLTTGITTGGSEGINRVIKTVARDAYGFQNPENQRLRTRTAATADTSTPLLGWRGDP